MTKVGYARVSTQDQHIDSQLDILTAAGCEQIFKEHASGTLAVRAELEKMMAWLRKGDTLVITKLDRLGRSVKNLTQIAFELDARGINLHVVTQGIDTSTPGGRLFFHILAAIAEFEHDLIVDRTRDGLAAARARGRKGGRPKKMTDAKIQTARRMYDAKEYTLQQIADTLGVSPTTIYRHLEGTQ